MQLQGHEAAVGRRLPVGYTTTEATPTSRTRAGPAHVRLHNRIDRVTVGNARMAEPKVAELEASPRSELMSEAWSFVVSFLEVSSFHGFNHLVARRRTAAEYTLWLIVLGLGVWGAVWISLSTWRRYQENPTVISMERNYQEWNTSFPAVTICPEYRVDPDKMNDLLAKYKDPAIREKVKMFIDQISSISFATLDKIEPFPNNPLRPSDYITSIYQTRFKFTYEVSNSLAGMEEDLTPTWTEMGLCYAYNTNLAIYNSNSYWSTNNWTVLPASEIINGNPLDGDLYSQVTKMNSGSKVFAHSCNDVPDAAMRPMHLPDSTYKTVDMNALTIYSTEETKSLSMKQRKCRFLDESDLAISPVYSYNLCRMDCRRRLSIALCKCSPQFYRHRPNDNSKICDIEGLRCLFQYSEMLIKLFNYDIGKKIECSCLPPCDDVTYGLELEQDMPWFLGTYIKWGVTKYPRMRLKRDILFGFSDLLVSIGGTAGLFLGCSVLSFIEIFYFFTVRLAWHVCHRMTVGKKH